MSGEIPPELGSLANLRLLHLSGNELSGEIPPELGSLANLRLLHLSGNELSGEIPPELGSLANLRLLHLSGNELSGEIPPELGSLANLEWLDLRGNELIGEIPPELGSLANLLWLYLSDNQLSGCIPEELRDAVDNDLEYLDLPFCDVLLSESPLGAPAISDVTPGTGSLTVAWYTPSQTGGSAIAAYDLRLYPDRCRRDGGIQLDGGAGCLDAGLRFPAVLPYRPDRRHTVRRAGAGGQRCRRWPLVGDRHRDACNGNDEQRLCNRRRGAG